MHPASPVELSFGPARWFCKAGGTLAVLGVLAILGSPAGGAWKLGFISLLSIVYLLSYAHTVSSNRTGTLIIYPDYRVEIHTTRGNDGLANLAGHGWLSRWFSVLTLVDEYSRARMHCLVFSSENSPDTYRRLLVAMRMRSAISSAQGLNW